MCGAPDTATAMNEDRQKVLIVDDQRAVREELAFALGFEGYEVAEAQDGREALERVAAGGIDLILLDRPGDRPLGAWEVTTPPTPAAIANALDDATGIRLRDLPLTTAALRDRVLVMDDAELARVLVG